MTEQFHNSPPQGGGLTCANCYAEFQWEPFERQGVVFCCAGCADGGPCVCTYLGPPGSEPTSQSFDRSRQPETAAGGRSPTAGRRGPGRDIVLAAIAELPAELQQVVEMRVTREVTPEQIARETGIDPGEVERRLSNAAAIMQRILGGDFVLRYIPVEESAGPGRAAERTAEPVRQAGSGSEGQSDLPSLITSSLSALARPLLGRGAAAGAETREAQDTIREALREASELFRLAAERLESREEEARSLRDMLRDQPSDEITLSIEGVYDPSALTHELESLGAIRHVRLESVEDGQAAYRLQADSVSAVVKALLSLEGDLRPGRLRVLGDEIRATLGGGVPAGGNGRLRSAGPVYELGADAFFGARHFVTMNGVQGPPHHHSYRVEVLMESGQQSDDGVVMGFGEARALIETIVLDYNETLLNTVPPFDVTQPTAENISRVIFERLAAELEESPIRLKQVRVWESPTNSASYSDAALAR